MAESPSPFRRIAALAVIAAAGASSWYFLSDEKKDELEIAVRQTVKENVVRPLMESVSEPKPRMPEPPREAGASLRDGGAPAAESREEALIREIESAIAGTESPERASSGEASPQAEGSVTASEMQADDTKEDPVMGFDFVKDFAGYLASSYVPGKNGAPGRTTVSMVKANARYSSSPRLHSMEADPFRAREAVIRHICRPGVLEAIYKMYAPRLLADMEDSARREGKDASDEGIGAMFEAYAAFFEKAANSLEASGQVDLKTIVGIIRSASGREAAANEDFSRAYNAHAEAMASGNREEAVIQGRRMAESARLAGMHASTQEKAKGDIAWAMRRRSGKMPVMGEEDLVFLGEWLMRHGVEAETSGTAAVLLRKFSGLCREKAAALKAGDAPEAPAAVPSGTADAPEADTMPPAMPEGKPGTPRTDSAVQAEGAPAPADAPASESRTGAGKSETEAPAAPEKPAEPKMSAPEVSGALPKA